MTLAAVAFLPGAPLALPTVSHGQYPEHRTEVTRLQAAAAATVEAALAGAEVVVAIAPGVSRRVRSGHRADLRGLGLPHVTAELPGHPLVTDVAALLGVGPVKGSEAGPHDSVEGDVLGLLAAGAGEPAPAFVLVELAASTTGEDAVRDGAALADLLEDRPERVALLVAADLSAALDTTSPRYEVPGADDIEEQIVTTVRARDLDALAGLTPRAIEARVATWSSLVAGVAAAAAAGVPTGGLTHLVTRGVGHLVGAAATEHLDLAPQP